VGAVWVFLYYIYQSYHAFLRTLSDREAVFLCLPEMDKMLHLYIIHIVLAGVKGENDGFPQITARGDPDWRDTGRFLSKTWGSRLRTPLFPGVFSRAGGGFKKRDIFVIFPLDKRDRK
jgi:hypothetical protein